MGLFTAASSDMLGCWQARGDKQPDQCFAGRLALPMQVPSLRVPVELARDLHGIPLIPVRGPVQGRLQCPAQLRATARQA
jgi:hypothetical protein